MTRPKLFAFEKRKAANAKKNQIDNANLYAGSPMYYYCKLCGNEMMLDELHKCVAPWFCEECIAEGRAVGPNQPVSWGSM